MRKYVKVIVCAILVLVLTSGAILAFADENPSVAAGSIIPSDFLPQTRWWRTREPLKVT